MIREIIMNNNREKTKIQIKKTINNKDNNKILCLNAAKIINKIKKKNTQNNHIQYQMMTIFKNYRLTNRVYRINKIINILKINLYIIMIISYTEIKIIQTNIIRNTKKMQIKMQYVFISRLCVELEPLYFLINFGWTICFSCIL